MFKIDIHTHIIPQNLNNVTKHFSDDRFLIIKNFTDTSADLYRQNSMFRHIKCNCWDANYRLDDMSKSSIDMQVLSTIPVLFSYWSKIKESMILYEFLNDHLHEVMCQFPSKYFALGNIPMQDTNLAIKEMDRCINDLKLNGIQIGSNINGNNLSDKKYLPVFEHAENINCPIFIHPWEVIGESSMKKYWLPWLVGMPAETSRAICSIIFVGILEKYPKLKIAFAHGGGSFPYTIGRIDKGFTMRPDLCAIDNNILPSTYLNSFYVDSLVHNLDSLEYLIKTIGYNKIALGTDYPFPLGETEPGELIKALNVEDDVKQRMYAGTALEWLGIDEKKYF